MDNKFSDAIRTLSTILLLVLVLMLPCITVSIFFGVIIGILFNSLLYGLIGAGVVLGLNIFVSFAFSSQKA